jgi:hypothetical protein
VLSHLRRWSVHPLPAGWVCTGQSHRDHSALAHAAAQAEGIFIHQPVGFRNTNPVYHFYRSLWLPALTMPLLCCSRMASMIWLPTVYIGLSEVIGSWKIIAISAPRIVRICDCRAAEVWRCRLFQQSDLHFAFERRWYKISPPTILPGERMICSSDRAVTLFPQPLSPTTHSVLPRFRY